MAKKNQVTAHLRIDAEANLKNGQNFVKDMQAIANGFDKSTEIYKKFDKAITDAQKANNVLKGVKNKTLLTKEELDNINKANKDLAKLKQSVAEMYNSYSDAELVGFSKEYVQQLKQHATAIEKIKNDFTAKTGKNLDKENANIDKTRLKIQQLEAEYQHLKTSGEQELITKQVDKLTQRLEAQRAKLIEIQKIQKNSSTIYQNTLNATAQKHGYKNFGEIANAKQVNEEQVAQQLGNTAYKEQQALLKAIKQEIKNIKQETEDVTKQNQKAAAFAEKYKLTNVKTLANLEEQEATIKNILAKYKNSKSELVTQTKITAEYEKQKKAALAKEDAILKAKQAEADYIAGNHYNSKASLSASATAAKKSIVSLESQLSDKGMETIVDDAAKTVAKAIKAVSDDLNPLKTHLANVEEANEKIATQTDNLASEQDIMISGRESANSINEHTTADGHETRKAMQKTFGGFSLADQDIIHDATNKTQDFVRAGSRSAYPAGGQLDVKALVRATGLNTLKIEQINKLDDVNKIREQIASATADEQEALVQQLVKSIEELLDICDQVLASELANLEANVLAAKEELNNPANGYYNKNGSLTKKGKKGKRGRELTDFINGEEVEKARLENAHAIARASLTKAKQSAIESLTSGEANDLVKNRNLLNDYAKGADKLRNSLSHATEESKYLGSAFDDVKNRIGYFLSLNFVFDQLMKKISEASQAITDIDKDMAQIGLVLGQTASQVWKNFDAYADMADRLNTTTSEVTASMKLFYQQGLKTVEVNKMVEASAIAAALGESSMAEASETLTSIINSYNLSANEAIEVTDKISQVAIESAADFGEISTAIEKVAASAASAGLDLDHLMGYLGKMIETTREAPTNIGTALKTIVANFTQFKEDPSGLAESGSDINKVDTALRTVGISLTDTQGEIRDLGNILDELGLKWDSLTRNQKAYLATSIAGTRQQSRFYALMNDYERTLELVEASTNSAGKASQQFVLYQDSLTASTKRLENEWEKFYASLLNNDGILKFLKDLGAGVLKIANGLGPVLTIITGGALTSVGRTLWSHFSQLTEQIRAANRELLTTQQLSKISLSNEIDGKTPMDFYQYSPNQTSSNLIGKNLGRAFFGESGKAELQQLREMTVAYEALKQRKVENLEIDWEMFGLKQADIDLTKIGKEGLDESTEAVIQNAIDTQAGAVAHKVNTAAKWGEVAAQLALTAALTLGAAAVVGLIKVAVNWYNADKNAAEQSAGAARELQTAYEDTKATYEDLQQTITNYQEGKEALNHMIESTDEWKQKIKELNEEVLLLLNQFPKLAQYISTDSSGLFTIDEEGFEQLKQWQLTALSQAEQMSLVGTKVANRAAIKNKQTELRRNSSTGVGGGTAQKLTGSQLIRVAYRGDGSGDADISLTEQGMERIYREYQLDPTIFVEDNADKLGEILETDNQYFLKRVRELKEEIIDLGDSVDANSEATQLLNQQLVSSFLGVEGSEEYQNSEYKGQIAAALADELEKTKQTERQKLDDMTDDEVHDAFAAEMQLTEVGGLFDQFGKSVFLNKEGQRVEYSDDFMRDYLATKRAERQIKDSEAGTTKTFNTAGAYLTGLYGETASKALLTHAREGINFNLLSPEEKKQLETRFATDPTLNVGSGAVTALGYKDMYAYRDAIQKAFDNYDEGTYWNSQYTTSSKNATSLQGIGDILSTGSAEDLDETQISYLETLEAKYENLGRIKNRTSHEYLEQLRQIKEQEEANALTAAQNAQDLAEERLSDAQIALAKSKAAFEADPNNTTAKLKYEADLKEVNAALENLKKQNSNVTLQIDADLKSDIDDAFGLANEFSNLKDLLKENYEVTFEEAQEIAERGFGAILENAKETADNTIRLDAKTVDAYIDAKQAELKADKETKIEQLENQKEILQASLGILEQEQAALTQAATAENEQDAQSALAKAMNYEAEYQAKRQTLEAEIKADNEANKAMSDNAVELYNALSSMYETDSQNEQNAIEAADTAAASHASNTIEYYKAMDNAVRQYARQVAAAEKGIDNGGIKQDSNVKKDLDTGDTKQTEATSNYAGTADTIENTLTNLIGGMEGDSAARLAAIKQAASKLLEDTKTRIKTVKNQIGEIDGAIAALRSSDKSLDKWQSTRGGALGGSGDSFDPMIEKLERFYNYLRQIELMEEEINRLREKRNLIDANKNYYIDDLKMENILLQEQQALYRDYIAEQGTYLKELQDKLTQKYSDWVYFNSDGVIQVKQTEFNLNSEKEQERYEDFSELLKLYEEEYNTREANQTKLTELEKTQLENIKSMYDKILSRVTDITDELNRQIDLLDHDMTMSFSNIAKFDIMDEKVENAADGLIRTLAYLQDFEKQVNNINDTVKNSQFSELFVWDETLGQWIANEEKLQDESVIKKYEDLGYTWQEIDTWVRDIVTRSQTLKTTIDETTDSSNQFAEALKTLLDDRISAIQDFYSASTEEMNKLFDKLDRKMTNADNANTLFGVASENLEAKYQTAKSAAEILKATVISLRDNKASILQQIQDEYPEYVDIIEGVAYVNKQAIEESTTLTDGQKAKLLQLYGVMEAAEEQTGEMEDKLFEYYNTMLEMEQAKRDAIIDMQQRVHDEMIARDQEEIDNLSEKYAKMNELDSEYYSKLQQRISDARNARADQQSANNLAQMQARLGVLQRDNSGAYNAELVELQRQINEQLQAQADKSIDDEMERISREQQERQEDREMQITQMENLLTFKDENGIYWQEALAMINGGPGSVVDYLMGSKEIQNSTMEMQAQSLEEMEDVAATATAELGNIVDGKIKEAMTGIVTGVTTSTEGLKTPLGEIKDAITTATAKYLETMSALFDYLGIEVAEDKAEEQGAETNTDTGSTTAPTPEAKTETPTTTTPSTGTTTKPPALKVGSSVKVKKGTKWYYTSGGEGPTGTAKNGKIKYINPGSKKPYNIDGLGWVAKKDIQGYNEGGYVDYTGIAAVHGTQNSPEAFLNAKQTALFEQLRDLLAKPASHMRDDNASGGDNISIESLTIDVKELADTDSIDKVVKTVKQSIYKDATNGNSMKINRRR